MKTLKTLAFWFSFFMLTLFLASCDDDDNGGSDKDRDNGNDSELIGIWYTADMTESITFRRDSTFTWDNGYRPYSGDFRYDEDSHTLVLIRDFVIDEDKEPKQEHFRVDIKNGKLTLTNLVNGYEYYFYKDGEYTDDNDEDNEQYGELSLFVGTWQTNGGTIFIFREDGTFYFDGEGIYDYDDTKQILMLEWNHEHEGTFYRNYRVNFSGEYLILTDVDEDSNPLILERAN